MVLKRTFLIIIWGCLSIFRATTRWKWQLFTFIYIGLNGEHTFFTVYMEITRNLVDWPMEHTKTFVSDVNYLPKQSYTVCAKFPKERLGTERAPRALFRHKMFFFKTPIFRKSALGALSENYGSLHRMPKNWTVRMAESHQQRPITKNCICLLAAFHRRSTYRKKSYTSATDGVWK